MSRVVAGVIAVLVIAVSAAGCWWGHPSTHPQPDAYVPMPRADTTPVAPPRTCSSVPCVANEPCVQTLAGDGTSGFADGLSATARFNHPWSVAVDGQGWVYVGDERNARIRVIRNGVVSTLAGSSNTSGSPDGPVDKAYFKGLQGIDVDAAGTVYVADRQARTIRVVSQGYVSTLPISGALATFDPIDVATHDGAVYVVDFGNTNCWSCTDRWPPYIGRVQQGKIAVLPETYTLDPVTTSMKSPHFLAQPQAVAIGADGRLYMPTPKGIRVLSSARTTLKEIELHQYFGTFFELADLAVDTQGRLYAAVAMYQRVALVGTDDKLTVIPPLPQNPENGVNDLGCVDGPASVARFRTPQGVAVDPSGQRIYVADTDNARIRVIELR